MGASTSASMTVVQLRAALEARGLSKLGLKGALVARLEEAQAGDLRGGGGRKNAREAGEEEEEEEEKEVEAMLAKKERKKRKSVGKTGAGGSGEGVAEDDFGVGGGDGQSGAMRGAKKRRDEPARQRKRVAVDEEEEEDDDDDDDAPEEVDLSTAKEGAKRQEEGAAKAVRAAERKAQRVAEARALVRQSERDVARAAREAKKERKAAREAAEEEEEGHLDEDFLPESVTAAVARAQADGAIRPAIQGPRSPTKEELAFQRTLRRREKRRRTKQALRQERVVGRFKVVSAEVRLAGMLGDDARGAEGSAAADAFKRATLFDPKRNTLVDGNIVRVKYGARGAAPADDF